VSWGGGVGRPHSRIALHPTASSSPDRHHPQDHIVPLTQSQASESNQVQSKHPAQTHKLEEKTYLGLITTKSTMTKSQPLQSNREFNITRSDNILNFEFREFSIES